MSKGHIINFREDGTFDGLHTDRTDVSKLGRIEVSRASWVDFNGETQKWEVRWTPKAEHPIFADSCRETCLAWEREQLQKDEVSHG
jgi:hypothetical protein